MPTPETITRALSMLAVYFETPEVTQEQIEIYSHLLNQSGVTDKQLIAACLEVCKHATAKYRQLPPVADILKYCRPDTDSEALNAWRWILKCRDWSIRNQGQVTVGGKITERKTTWSCEAEMLTYPEPDWTKSRIHQTTGRVIDALGRWQLFCESEPDKWLRKEFLEYYKIYSKQNTQAALPGAEQAALPEGGE